MSFQPIQERDASGALIAAGYEWVEQKDMPGIPLYLLSCVGVVAALAGLWVALVGDRWIGLSFIIGGLVVAIWAHRARKAYGEERRFIVFRTDDSVTTLSGTLPVKVSEILGIVNDVQYETSYISFSLRDGRKIEVVNGRELQNDDDGRLVHTQLVKAWEEIRGVIDLNKNG